MITVGHRRERPIAMQGDGTLLAEGARFSETIAHLAKSTFIPKDVYRFQSHKDANTQQEDCLVQGLGRFLTKQTLREKDAPDRIILERALESASCVSPRD